MSEEKKNEVTEEVKEEARELSEEEIAQVNGGAVPGFGAYGKEVKKRMWF